jgi:hypothetical protein
MTALSQATWRHCNMCKAGIGFEAEYFTCSVSTCNRKRTGLFFCSLACFEAHLPTARHRDAWAERQRSPSVAAARPSARRKSGGRRGCRSGRPEPALPPRHRAARLAALPPDRATLGRRTSRGEPGADVLIVVSKLKKYVRDRSGMNTSDGVVPILSDHLRELCREAIRHGRAGRSPHVLDRDFTKVLEQLAGASQRAIFAPGVDRLS